MNLRELRENAQMSIRTVAEKLHVTERAVYNYESGIRNIDIRQVLLLSELYNKTANEIILAQIQSDRPIK